VIDEELRAANLSIAPDAREALVGRCSAAIAVRHAELRKLTFCARQKQMDR